MPEVATTRSPSNSPSDRSSSAIGEGSSMNGPLASSAKTVLMARAKRGHSSGVIGRSRVSRSVTVGVYRAGTTIRQRVPSRLDGAGGPAPGDRLSARDAGPLVPSVPSGRIGRTVDEGVAMNGLIAERSGNEQVTELEPRLAEHRRELTGYCYRMLGSVFDAEDAVQETMVRAWRGLADFEGRSALRSWLYRIATNVCLDQLSGRQRRALPMDLTGSPYPPVEHSLAQRRPGTAWVEPMLDRQVIPEDADPAERIVAKESIRLAFVAALQHLPPRQRAVLILREVLRWKASEVAELLETSVASVNSALQRARAALDATDLDPDAVTAPLDEEQRALLDRYVAAFETFDIDALVQLLRDDATMPMPPYPLWLRGADE